MIEVAEAVLDTPLALTFLQLASATAVLFVAAIIVLHIMWHIGTNGLFYKKRQVAVDWNRRFYPSSIILLLFTIIIFTFLTQYES